ncbi:hypothetical protein [Campylobacter hominis]|uniref:hypothetical protein n=1 Tax=Campylobacter hominis TaxID=76517 RepID=UPI000E1FD769|nr:hypothetical protein K8O82_01675 [Campylobacter hominis]
MNKIYHILKTYQFNPAKYRKTCVKKISKESSEFIMKKLYKTMIEPYHFKAYFDTLDKKCSL